MRAWRLTKHQVKPTTSKVRPKRTACSKDRSVGFRTS
nr:MAG TPA: hypothetical protein [Inoviridae sp.]